MEEDRTIPASQADFFAPSAEEIETALAVAELIDKAVMEEEERCS